LIVRLVTASLRRRFRQLALIVVAVAVAAATVATLVGFSARAGALLGSELAAFGPNLSVRPQLGAPPLLPPTVLARVRSLPGVEAVHGIRPVEAAETGAAGGFSRLEVRAEPAQLAPVARRIEGSIEGVEATPLLRVSASDARLTRRLRLVLAALSGVSLLLALLSVASSTAALLGERRTEIGLMMALGYGGRRIGLFLAAELLAAALGAACLGALAGELAAGSLALHLLGPPPGSLLPAALGTLGRGHFAWQAFAAAGIAAVGVVGASLALTVRRLEQLDAAAILRGQA
jgi:hypothetical protein